MAPIPPEPFHSACERADPDALVSFVAVLYRERGWSVERRSGRRIVLGRDGDRRTIVVTPRSSADAADADVIVVPDGSGESIADARVLDFDALHERLCYAVEPAAAARIAETLGLAVDPSDFDSSTAATDDDTADDGTAESADQHGANPATERGFTPEWPVAVAAVLALAIVATVGWGAFAAIDGSTDATALSPTETATPVAPESAPPASARTATPTPGDGTTASAAGDGTTADESDDGDFAVYAAESRIREWDETDLAGVGSEVDRENLSAAARLPGVSLDGGINGTVLSRAHRWALANDSYTVRFTYRELFDGRVDGRYAERIRVAGDGRYRATTTTLGEFHTSVHQIVAADSYADDALFTRANGTVERSTFAPDIEAQIETAIRRYTAADDATVVGGRTDADLTTYRLATSGHDAPWARNTTGTLFLTERGVLTYGRWSYRTPTNPNIRVTVSLETTNVGATTVERPAWADDP